MRWLPPRDTWARDLLVAAAALAGGAVLLGLHTYPLVPVHPEVPAGWLFLMPLTAASVGLALRRRAPLVCLAIGVAAVLGDATLGGSFATVLVFTQVLYEACVHGPAPTWRWLLGISAGTIGGAMLVVLVVTGQWRPGVWAAVVGVLVLVFPVVTGLSVRQHRDRAETERERAEQTARLAELDRVHAITAERQRMARELHDVIANHLSAVSIHATAAQADGADQETVRKALAVIRSSAVAGLAEMRQMIRLLREPDRPVPLEGNGIRRDPGSVATDRLAEADQLVEAARRAGLAVRLAVGGSPRPLPTDVDLAAYRILQEALTNALKHGHGAPVQAWIGYRPDRVVVTVENPLPGPNTAGGDLPGAGAGLVGMRERATLLSGTFEAGRAGGDWRVHAELPDRPEVAR